MLSATSQPDSRSVLLLDDDAADGYLSLLRSKAPEITVFPISDVYSQSDCPADIWFGAPDKAAHLLAQGWKPRWLQLTWAGFSPLLKSSIPDDYLLSRAVDVFGQPMLEYVLFHMLAHVKPGMSCSENQERFIWGAAESGTLHGQRVMLVGAGNIGLYVAQRLTCLGMQVVGVQRAPKESDHLLATYDLDSFYEHLGEVDFVVNILPDTPETRNLFDRKLFNLMKPSALFINIGRGSAVVDADLVEAIGNNRIAAAVLDVFRHEPLPPSHQFWITPNITITPHIAGPANPEMMVDAFLSNFERFISNRPLKGSVDLSRGY